jgi:hypothetical protein
MRVRRFSTVWLTAAVWLLLTLAVSSSKVVAGDGGTVPPNPVAPEDSGSWSDDLGTTLVALDLIY